MNLVIKKINALMALMFFAILICIDVAIRVDEFPEIKTHRGDIAAGPIKFYLMFIILFSLLTPKLKTKHQVLISTVVSVTLILIFQAYFTTQKFIGMALGITSNISIFIYKLIKVRRLKNSF